MIIKRVLLNKTNGQRLVCLPMDCDIQKGDYVKIVKIEDDTQKKEEVIVD